MTSNVAATIANFAPLAKINGLKSKPLAKDLSHHISLESAARKPSPLKEAALYMKDPELISLGGGLPDPTYFPFHQVDLHLSPPGHWLDGEMETLSIDKFSENGVSMNLARALQYSQGSGQPELSAFVKQHTEMIHHPKYSNWDVMLNAGNTNAIDTCLRMLLNRGDTLLLEEYSFPSVLECARPQGIHPAAVKLDEYGVIPALLDEQLSNWDEAISGRRPRVLYIVPTGQNPTGSTLSAQRRQEVYNICVKHDLIILEDEPYYFLQMPTYKANSQEEPLPKTSEEFIDSLVPSILSMDTEGRVIRLDSFSKVLAPGCRCGWLTGSSQFMERALRCNEVSIQSPAGFSQVLVHGLLNTWGHAGYLNWLVHIRAEYTRRRDGLLSAMEASLPKEYCSWTAPTAGMFVWITIDAEKHPDFMTLGIDNLEKQIFQAAIAEKVLVAMGSWFISDRTKERPGLFFRATFAASRIEKMHEAMARLGRALRSQFESDKHQLQETAPVE